MRLALLVVVTGLVMGGSPLEGAQDARAILSLVVNQTAAGESLVILRGNGSDVLVQVTALEAAGLQRVAGVRERIDGRDFVSLRSLAPHITFELDEANLQLRVQASADLFGRRRLELNSVEPAGTVHTRNASAFFNYAASWSGSGSPLLSGELGVHTGAALVTTTLARRSTGAVQRGLTTASIDQPRALRRFAFGDTTIQGGPLSGSAIVGGFSVSREFSLNPYFVRFPTPRLSETLTTPSTVDVYVNDRLVRRAELPPGVFDVTGVPALNGPGQTRLVIRDAFGRSSEIATNYYVTTAVLSRGLQDYQYGIGFRRTVDLQGGADYREPVFVGSHRVGITDGLTAGVRVEGERRLFSGGPTVTARAGHFGQIELAGSVSRDDHAQGGGAASAAWTYSGRRMSAGASLRAFSPNYVTVGDPRPSGASRVGLSAFTGLPLGKLGTINIQHQEYRQPSGVVSDPLITRGRRFSIGGSSRVTRRAHLLWTAARVWGRQSDGFELFTGISISVGPSGTAMMAAERQSGRTSSSLELQKPLTTGEGVGYRLRGDVLGNSADASAQYQSRYGRYELQQNTSHGTPNTTVTLSGGIVAIGRSVQFTRPVQESYALVQVPGVEGVRVYSSNLEIGRTGRSGKLLVPALLPNYANRVAVSEQDIPADRAVPDGEKLIAPPWRGGALITFPSARLQAATGHVDLRTAGGDRAVPAFGLMSVTVEGTRDESPIGSDGTFFFEQLPPGQYAANVKYLGETCTFTLTVPAAQGFLADLGQVTCETR